MFLLLLLLRLHALNAAKLSETGTDLPGIWLFHRTAVLREVVVTSLCGLGQVIEELVGILVIAVERDGVDGNKILHLNLGNDRLGWLHKYIIHTSVPY